MRSPVTDACPAHGSDPQLRPSMLKGASAALAPNLLSQMTNWGTLPFVQQHIGHLWRHLRTLNLWLSRPKPGLSWVYSSHATSGRLQPDAVPTGSRC